VQASPTPLCDERPHLIFTFEPDTFNLIHHLNIDQASYLAFTRYSFTSSRLCTNRSSSYSSHPPALPTLLQYFCTTIRQYTNPPSTFLVYAIHHKILVIPISCKFQHHTSYRPLSRPFAMSDPISSSSSSSKCCAEKQATNTLEDRVCVCETERASERERYVYTYIYTYAHMSTHTHTRI